jgi:hypothetical protein
MTTSAFRTGEVVPGNRSGGPKTAALMGLVDLIRIELTTSALRTQRSPS